MTDLHRIEADVVCEAASEVWKVLQDVSEALKAGKVLFAGENGCKAENPVVLDVLRLTARLEGEFVKRICRK